MKIDEFFENEYLIPGNTYDNFIFENCPNEFLSVAKTKLSQSNNEVKSLVICLDRKQEGIVEQVLNNCADDYQRKILARDFIVALIMREGLVNTKDNQESIDFVNLQIDAFLHNDFDKVKELHTSSYMPYDIKKTAKSIGKIELSFILDATENQSLQQAINIFISSREPYSVKIFTNNKSLSTYYDLNGNLIECPHDFMRRNVNKFIEEDSIDKEQ